ncbi:DUF2147 domain-containing protein [Antarcticibacterium flavum]|uniref:DUF2147 domain-containing protein n=1 Tax=Antarcticibacterium flavum TaxID=2058175 RepID=A0A5B7X0Y2_9FLAO|nr:MULTISPECIES: DUF2147 domain-containing protein [Antarcticibacterium]MCM4161166.1 DUF2147 domain-containing protein [Antarcticibacterium sp. W02-3]QCY68328.1 DUF2147 domain-containing protein [Antarcticibacterium flavum]
MKKIKNICLLALLFVVTHMNGQSVFGKWETINEETGKPNSIIEIYEEDGRVHGKVVRILKKEDRDRTCSNCEGHLKDKPLEGLELMTGLEKNGNEYSGGVIVDPETGKEYKCKIWVDETNPDLLKVRGYIAFFYKTKTWHRLE